MPKEDLRIRKTKKVLFRTLLQLLETNEFHDITVTKLCAKSEINRSTFYMHYANIDDLFETQMLEIMQHLNAEFEKSYEKIFLLERSGLENVYQHILDHRYFYDILFSEKIPSKYNQLFIDHYMQRPKDLIIQSVRLEIDYELYHTFCVSATIGLIRHWSRNNYDKTALEMSRQTMSFFSNEL